MGEEYNLSDIIVNMVVPDYKMGNYAFGYIDKKDGAFVVCYVGRSDSDLKKEIKQQMKRAPAVIVIVQTGQIVVDERIAVHHFQCAGRADRRCGLAAYQIAGRQRQHAAHPLAAAQQAVGSRTGNSGFLRCGKCGIQQFRQGRFHGSLISGKLFLKHLRPPAMHVPMLHQWFRCAAVQPSAPCHRLRSYPLLRHTAPPFLPE